MNIDILAYFGGFFISMQLIPQIQKTLHTKSADHLSSYFLTSNLIGLIFMSSYALCNNDIPLLITTSVSSFNTTLLICIKLYFTLYKN